MMVYFLYSVALISLPIIIGLTVFVSTYFISLKWITEIASLSRISSLLLMIFPLLINTIIFSLFYIIVPNLQVKWRYAFLGGFIAATLFELANKIFVFYIKNFPGYELIYGTLSIIPIFFVWIYIVWVIILYGALVVNGLHQVKRPT